MDELGATADLRRSRAPSREHTGGARAELVQALAEVSLADERVSLADERETELRGQHYLRGQLDALHAALDGARAQHAATLEQAQAAGAASEARAQGESAAREVAESARAYVKNVLLRAMEKGGVDAVLDQALFPVIATSLQFTAEETRNIAQARAGATRSRAGRGWLG
ncbi:hypothetical protein T492DRAFT_890049 [Pavlovales sp. CCMP2436]|nr:hypothetical protein T492DRAFT_890049 [Pavlovales sp. CCMP2436]